MCLTDKEAAKKFLLGHLKTIIGIEFDLLDVEYSEGCKKACSFGEKNLKIKLNPRVVCKKNVDRLVNHVLK